MKTKFGMVFLIILVIFSSYPCSAQTSINVGDKYYYSVYSRETTIYGGETYNDIWDYDFYLDVQDVIDDTVYLFWCQYSVSPCSMKIYGEDNYNPFDLNYPGYFVNITDLDFLYSVWPDRWVSEEVIECTASNRRFYASAFNSSESFSYGYNHTIEPFETLYDSGEESYSYELIYNENGVREYFKIEHDFKGSIIEYHDFHEVKLTDSTQTVCAPLYTTLLSLLIGSLVIVQTRRRRQRK